MEWLGAIGNVAAAGLGAWGHTKDQENLKIKMPLELSLQFKLI